LTRHADWSQEGIVEIENLLSRFDQVVGSSNTMPKSGMGPLQRTINQALVSVDRLINIELFGQTYSLKASGQVSQAEEVANYVAEHVEKVRAAAEVPSKVDTLILAVLNIANDYFEMKRSHQDLAKDIDRRCKALIEYIDTNP